TVDRWARAADGRERRAQAHDHACASRQHDTRSNGTSDATRSAMRMDLEAAIFENKKCQHEHYPDEQLVARGKAARKTTPRARQADLEITNRPDPVALLEEQARSRVPELVPIRYGRMLVSPFTFFRGAALIMASDLSRTPDSGIRAQLCGDAHLMNFGLFGS